MILFLFSLTGQTLAQEDLPKLVKKIQPAVVTIITYNALGKVKAQGSGFFISPNGYFLTNYHVLAGATRVELRTLEGLRYTMTRVVAQDQAGDLAVGVIKPPPVNLPCLKISSVSPEMGERVVVIGSPMGLEQTLSDGLVSSIRQIPKLGAILQITAPISSGSSGSPVVNLKGEVIGVATFLFKEGQNLNFAIPGSRALALQHQATKRHKYPESLRTETMTAPTQHPTKPVPSGETMPYPSDGTEGKYLRDYLGNEIKYPLSIVGKINSAGAMNGYYIESPSLKNRDVLPGIMIVNYDEELLDILQNSEQNCHFIGLSNKDHSVIFIKSINNKNYTGKLRPHLLQKKSLKGMEFTLTGKINMSAVIGYCMTADNGINVSFGEELPKMLDEILNQAYKTNRKLTVVGELFPKEGIRGSNYFYVTHIAFEGDPILPIPKYRSKN